MHPGLRTPADDLNVPISRLAERCIVQALLVLLRTDNFDDITVSQIAAKAGVNRSSYYRHFPSKTAVVERYYEALLVGFRETALEGRLPRTMEQYLEAMFSYYVARSEDLLTLHRRGLSHWLLPSLTRAFDPGPGPLPRELATAYHAGGVFASFLWWFDRSMDDTPRAMARRSCALLPPGWVPLLLRDDMTASTTEPRSS